MKKTIIYFTLFFFTTILFNCKKYPQGGCEKRGPKNIIDEWHLSLYEVDGIDSTNLINYNGNEDYKRVLFLKENTHYNPHTYCRINDKFEMIVFFRNDNEEIEFESNGSPEIGKMCYMGLYNINKCYKMIFNPEHDKTRWKIQKLTRKQMVLTTNSTHSYLIKLNQ